MSEQDEPELMTKEQLLQGVSFLREELIAVKQELQNELPHMLKYYALDKEMKALQLILSCWDKKNLEV